MKILHTGDWHLGKLVHGLHMTADQAHIIQDLYRVLKEEKIELLIIAGDVYDRSIPPTEAVELLDETLTTIVMDMGIQVIMIAGNHDSPDRLDFGSKILKDKGLHIAGRLTKSLQTIRMNDTYGPIDFHLIPYVEPAVVKALYDLETCRSHDEAMKVVIDDLKENMDEGVRNVCIGHGFVMGTETLETSDSERPLAIGGSEYIDVNYFEVFDYTALGHLHGPQKIKHDHIRYAGSLLKYSFSEVSQKKSVTLVELREKGQVSIEQRTLSPIRDMRIIKGNLEDLLSDEVSGLANKEDYICAVLTDRGKLFEPMKQLRSVYPNVLLLERERSLIEEEVSLTAKEIKAKTPEEQFRDFYAYVSGEALSEDEEALFSTAYNDIQEEERSK